MAKYENLPILSLPQDRTLLCTDALPEITHLEDPALAVMLDFNQAPPHTITPEDPIDDALSEMKLHGEHLLFVTNDQDHIEGLIASEDILGEQPIKITQERRIPRSKILTKMIMVPLDAIIAFSMETVQHAKVGHIVNTLKAAGRHYALVINNNTSSDDCIVRGIFTTSNISRQLHMDIAGASKTASVSELRKHQDLE